MATRIDKEKLNRAKRVVDGWRKRHPHLGIYDRVVDDALYVSYEDAEAQTVRYAARLTDDTYDETEIHALRMARMNGLAAMRKALEARYPHLYLSLSMTIDGIRLSGWTARVDSDGRRREGTGMGIENDFTSPELHAELARLDHEAENAAEEGYFFCSGHNRAEPQGDYDYHYFTGKYCKEYGNLHPQHRREAINERYN